MERHIEVENMEILINLFGSFDENLRLIEKEFDVGNDKETAAESG